MATWVAELQDALARLRREIGPVSLDVHRSIKAALDPAGSLNPGTVFRPAGPTANLVP